MKSIAGFWRILILCRRVFGNIFSNLLKYADGEPPGNRILSAAGGLSYHLFWQLCGRGPRRKGEHRNPALRPALNIIGDHGGSFYSGPGSRFFLTKISLPLIVSESQHTATTARIPIPRYQKPHIYPENLGYRAGYQEPYGAWLRT